MKTAEETLRKYFDADNSVDENAITKAMKEYAIEYNKNEIWKPIKGYEGLYLISNLGRCMNIFHKGNNRSHIMKPNITPNGYYRFALSKDGIVKYYFAHRLLMISFKPIRGYNRYDVNHINGYKTDNRLDNLEWCTRSENVKHAFDNGLNRFNYKRNNIKLTPEKSVEIYNRLLKGEKNKVIADEYRVSISAICDIKSGRRWSEFTVRKQDFLSESNIPQL